MDRRHLLGLGAALPFAPRALHAQPTGFPSQPIRLVIPFAAGGPTDLGARLLADELSKLLPQRVVPENRTGAAAMIGAQVVAQAPKDGHTILYAAHAHVLLRALYPRAGFDPVEDFAPIALVATVPLILVVNKDLPARNLREFMDLARKDPGRYDYGSSGNGGTIQLATELFLHRAGGLRVNHVPYRGSAAAMPDLLSGRIAMFMDVASTALPLIERGDVRALAISSARRSPLAPGIPTFQEEGIPGYEAYTWHMVLAPAGTPDAVLHQLNAAINRVLAEPAVRKKLLDWGAEIRTGSTPESTSQFLREELAKWEPVIREAGITAN